MTLSDFTRSLFERGLVQVDPTAEPSGAELQATAGLLIEYDEVRRWEMAGTPPPFHAPAATWAADTLYRACQLVAYRSLGPAAVDALVRVPYPDGPASAIHYSVDLTWQFLPDVARLARHAAPADPLLDCLQRWAADWPLSSVGMPDIRPTRLDPILSHPSLRRCYVDRVIQRRDASRLAEARVRDEVRAALGCYSELAPLLVVAPRSTDLGGCS